MLKASRLLKEWRTAKGLTQTEAAELVGASAAAFCEWENGKGIPKLPQAFRIRDVARVALGAWLVTESAQKAA